VPSPATHASQARPLRIYLIAPRTPDSFWSMQGTVDAVGVRSLMPSGALATLISLTPPELRGAVEYRYCDENLDSVQWDLPCDLVAISGFTLHAERIAAIAGAFRSRGVPVALGGAFATLDTELARPLCHHLFVGEGELTWPRFLRDWVRGEAQPLYEQTEHVEMSISPPPDWRHVDGGDYLYMTVQSARGCPNKCDFCDAIQLIGRRHRRKPIDQVLVEVDAAYRAGCEVIFFSDDNFMVHRGYTRGLLKRLIDWNTALPHPVQFSCQTSVTITDDEEILRLMADARFAAVFLGVESLRRECLEEINKGHLYRADMADRIRAMARYGLLPFIGLIVGFDADDDDSFDEIERFLDQTGSPIASLSVLNAPEGTPLHTRLTKAGRIDDRFAGVWHFSTNIVPLTGTREALLARHRELFCRLYEPANFERRAMRWLQNVEHFPTIYTRKRKAWTNALKISRVLRHYSLRVPPPVRQTFFNLLRQTWTLDKRLIRKAITVMTQYCHYYGFVSDEQYKGTV
jgi:pyruvate-formate lyase-activating enzyme